MLNTGMYKIQTHNGTSAVFEILKDSAGRFSLKTLSDPDNLLEDLMGHGNPVRTLAHLQRNPYFSFFKLSDEPLTKSGPDESDEPHLQIKDPSHLEDILNNGSFVLISASRTERSPEENEKNTEELLNKIKQLGYKYTPAMGHYEQQEPSFMVHGMSLQDATNLARHYGQKSHIQSNAGHHEEIPHFSDYKPFKPVRGHKLDNSAQEYYTEITHPDGTKSKFQIPFV